MEGNKGSVPAWHIQDDAFGVGKERSKGELICLFWGKRLAGMGNSQLGV